MPEVRDVRTLVVKLLKAHHLRYMNFWKEPDPETGVSVTLIKFRRDKEHNPKAFFDSLNETGFQYKKLSKDPEALEIVCEIWPRGEKGKVTEMREDSRRGVGTGGGQDAGNEQNSGNGSLRYMGIPHGDSQLNLVQSLAQELVDAGYEEGASMVLRVAGEQDWDEFRRKVGAMFRRLRLHQHPAIRQLKEQIASEIISALGSDAALYGGLRGSELEKRLNEVVNDNIDLILDTRGIADSVLRRTGSSTTRVAYLQRLRDGLLNVQVLAVIAENDEAEAKVEEVLSQVAEEESPTQKTASTLDLNSPFLRLVADQDYESAYLFLLTD